MSGTEKKSDTVRRLVRGLDYRSALRIAKEFRLGISKDDRDAMRLAYGCKVSSGFYQQLGRDPVAEIECGVGILVRLYGTQREEVKQG